MPKPDRFLSFAQVAEMICLSVKTIRNGGGGTKDLPRVRLGRRVMFSQRAVEAWMAAKAREGARRRVNPREVVADILSDKRGRRAAVNQTLTTIINGGRYK